MKTILFFLFIYPAYSIDVSDPKVRQFEHENPGCPINSNCSNEMGFMLDLWLKQLESPSKTKVKKLEDFRKKHGTPIQILAKKEIYQNADPILWNSRCRFHNPKNPNQTVYRGYAFLKDKLQVPGGHFTEVYRYKGEEKTKYHIPYGDQVTLIKNDKLIVLKDYEDNYYKIAIGSDLKYQIAEVGINQVNLALRKKIKDIKCPTDIELDKDYFKDSFCQKVLNVDSGKLEMIQLTWACP